MSRTIPAFLAVGLLAVTIAACSSAPAADTKPAPAASADTISVRCHAQDWPQIMPNLAGKNFDAMSPDLVCFDHLKALAPDGHDIMADAANAAGEWVIVSSDPGPGASVRISTLITLKLRAPKPVR
ncbi:hypothetical protein ACFYRN_24935 [Streptomyces sp. NPDC005227]|uniref:hypothetical protein n=1 Tax=Streptomyces sp. NPDC005227 TaxID=3364707 RepID=UPI0036802D1B